MRGQAAAAPREDASRTGPRLTPCLLQAAARAAWMCAREEARARVSAAAPARALSRGPLRARLSAAALDALQPLVALAERADDLPGLAEFEKVPYATATV